MTKSTITREQLLEIIETDHVQCGEASYLARMALAAMDQKPALHRYRRKAVEPYGPYPWHYEVFVDYPQPFEDIEDEYFYAAPPVVTGFAVDGESERLPLDYLQGHKDGLEWAAQLAEANHPETGDWLYDDPIELAKAIRKGPDMPPVQPVADSEPVAEITEDLGRLFVKIHYPTTLRAGDKLYRHAQPAPVVPDAATAIRACLSEFPESARDIVEECADIAENACRAAMLQASPVCTCPSGDGSLRWPCPVHPGNSPAIPDGYVMVPMRLTAENGAKGALSGEFSETKFVNCPECFGDDECETCDGSGRIEITVPVTWTTIKDIWAKGVEHFAAAPQEVKGEQGRTD
ncbi:TPA: DUF551 domain-containing protein [Klebsiella pneumoniae]|nr:DUF551 domain-containing protein [Klebsiella pneumoniae]